MRQELQLIGLYCYVCDQYNHHLRWNVQRMGNNGLEGQITDPELITIYLYCLIHEEKTQLKSMHTHILRHWDGWFRQLPSYQAFVKRLNRLVEAFVGLVDQLLADLPLPAEPTPILLVDSMPIVTCSGKPVGKVAPGLLPKPTAPAKERVLLRLQTARGRLQTQVADTGCRHRLQTQRTDAFAPLFGAGRRQRPRPDRTPADSRTPARLHRLRRQSLL